ncbi:MAG: hypothetical protein U0168_17440 [Nannocystaceae bacterium]
MVAVVGDVLDVGGERLRCGRAEGVADHQVRAGVARAGVVVRPIVAAQQEHALAVVPAVLRLRTEVLRAVERGAARDPDDVAQSQRRVLVGAAQARGVDLGAADGRTQLRAAGPATDGEEVVVVGDHDVAQAAVARPARDRIERQHLAVAADERQRIVVAARARAMQRPHRGLAVVREADDGGATAVDVERLGQFVRRAAERLHVEQLAGGIVVREQQIAGTLGGEPMASHRHAAAEVAQRRELALRPLRDQRQRRIDRRVAGVPQQRAGAGVEAGEGRAAAVAVGDRSDRDEGVIVAQPQIADLRRRRDLPQLRAVGGEVDQLGLAAAGGDDQPAHADGDLAGVVDHEPAVVVRAVGAAELARPQHLAVLVEHAEEHVADDDVLRIGRRQHRREHVAEGRAGAAAAGHRDDAAAGRERAAVVDVAVDHLDRPQELARGVQPRDHAGVEQKRHGRQAQAAEGPARAVAEESSQHRDAAVVECGPGHAGLAWLARERDRGTAVLRPAPHRRARRRPRLDAIVLGARTEIARRGRAVAARRHRCQRERPRARPRFVPVSVLHGAAFARPRSRPASCQ